MYKIGIDLGGTKIEGVLLDQTGKILARERCATEQERGYAHILGRIEALYRSLVKRSGGAQHTFGIGTPGAISPRSGLLRNSNTQCLNNQPFKQDLEAALSRKIAIQNDANCFAMAEAGLGAAQGRNLVFGVIMGTGCGGGIVYKGEVVTGPLAIAGEWGHTTIDPHGPQCWCGKRGCVETLISGGGLERLYMSRYGMQRALADIVGDLRAGDAHASEFMDEFFGNFGRALSNVVNILDPDMVVLGGGVSNIDELYNTGILRVREMVFSDCCETPIVKNQLGDSAGVIGAALIGV
jgi:fructokinase